MVRGAIRMTEEAKNYERWAMLPDMPSEEHVGIERLVTEIFFDLEKRIVRRTIESYEVIREGCFMIRGPEQITLASRERRRLLGTTYDELPLPIPTPEFHSEELARNYGVIKKPEEVTKIFGGRVISI